MSDLSVVKLKTCFSYCSTEHVTYHRTLRGPCIEVIVIIPVINYHYVFFFMTAVTGIAVFKSVRDRQGVHRKEKKES